MRLDAPLIKNTFYSLCTLFLAAARRFRLHDASHGGLEGL